MDGFGYRPKTQKFADIIRAAGTVVWNGPVVYLSSCFRTRNCAIAAVMAETDAVTIIGGGDSAAAVKQFGYENDMTHISTGGGAYWNCWKDAYCPEWIVF